MDLQYMFRGKPFETTKQFLMFTITRTGVNNHLQAETDHDDPKITQKRQLLRGKYERTVFLDVLCFFLPIL
jgi:hypothetical protein